MRAVDTPCTPQHTQMQTEADEAADKQAELLTELAAVRKQRDEANANLSNTEVRKSPSVLSSSCMRPAAPTTGCHSNPAPSSASPIP